MALNVRQEKFAVEYARTGNATQAAKNAGYSQKTAYAQGSMLLKNLEVLARKDQEYQAMLSESREKLSRMVMDALSALHDTLKNAPPGSMARVQAANVILEKSGLNPDSAGVTVNIDNREITFTIAKTNDPNALDHV